MADKLIITSKKIYTEDYTEAEKKQMEDRYLNPIISDDKIDHDKIAMAEAIIDLNNRMLELEKGGE